MTIKNEVLVRMYIVLAGIVLAAVVIFGMAVKITVVDGEKWRAKSAQRYVKTVKIEADRGNILSADGSLLATSLPFFDIFFDPNSSGMKESDFINNVDSLAYLLANYVDPALTEGGWREKLINARAAGSKYMLIKRNVNFAQKQEISQFPLFNLGKFRGGFIAEAQADRENPFGMMAERTIGYAQDSVRVGLEGKFNRELAGKAGEQQMLRIAEGVWKPLEDLGSIEPESGLDIRTTIDIDLQDITERALLRAVQDNEAKYGTAIVMEVETGAIRAIANLGRSKSGKVGEIYNYAVGTATEPGSTFKAASMLALLEDGHVRLGDTIDLERGRTQFYDETMEDSSPHGLALTSVQRAFEISSNVGIAKLVQRHYGGSMESARKFIERLHAFRLNLPTGIEIVGEAAPLIKQPHIDADDWSGITLPWMATGYELRLTPLQMLTFYNTIANDGLMVQPQLVTAFERYGETVEHFPTTVVKQRIAGKEAIEDLQVLLESVVENGTARKYKSDRYRFAGKTGTSQLNYQRLQAETRVGGYQASFAGYFPAENPQYSCIVLISEPQSGRIYGSTVALPVFKEIADRVVSIKSELYLPLNDVAKPPLANRELPRYDVGDRRDLQHVMHRMALPIDKVTAAEWAVSQATPADSLNLLARKIRRKQVPNVVGMGLRDALYILENQGLDVEVEGFGKVVRQSVEPGTTVRGQAIKLKLS